MNAPDDLLYRKALLRLAADATGAGTLAAPDAGAAAYNPACGDRVSVSLKWRDGRIAAFAHETQACLLAQASAARLAEAAPGLDTAGLQALAEAVAAMLAGGPVPPGYEAFEGVGAYAGRHRCVLLPFEAVLEAVKGGG